MKFHVLIFTSGIFTGANLSAQSLHEGKAEVFPDTTITLDTAWYNHLWDSLPIFNPPDEVRGSEFPWDTSDTWPWAGDTNNFLNTTYTVIVSGPNPCVDTSRQSPDVGMAPLHVTFVDISSSRSYPWHTSWDPWSITGCMGTVYYPYKSWYEINLFDTAKPHTSRIGFAATRAMEISTVPPTETPEPAKPVSLPEQPWYQAVLPTPVRIRKG